MTTLRQISHHRHTLLVLNRIDHNFVRRNLDLLHQNTKRMMASHRGTLTSTLVRRVFTFSFTINPILPAMFNLLSTITFQRFRHILRNFLRVQQRHHKSVSTSRHQEQPATNRRRTLNISSRSMAVLISGLTLATRHHRHLITIIIMVHRDLFRRHPNHLTIVLY